ncbi:hypothetical protein DBY21_10135 [Candidatus Gastranaerophilales bacterium]|nr:MAG: hypothetical protein DBY21_10135 [Candidatus Gastranaerophilales bacterium]
MDLSTKINIILTACIAVFTIVQAVCAIWQTKETQIQNRQNLFKMRLEHYNLIEKFYIELFSNIGSSNDNENPELSYDKLKHIQDVSFEIIEKNDETEYLFSKDVKNAEREFVRELLEQIKNIQNIKGQFNTNKLHDIREKTEKLMQKNLTL